MHSTPLASQMRDLKCRPLRRYRPRDRDCSTGIVGLLSPGTKNCEVRADIRRGWLSIRCGIVQDEFEANLEEAPRAVSTWER